MVNSFLIFLGKLTISFSKSLNLGNGSTWPGHIALSINKNFIKDILKHNPNLKIILIAGTNGKTTTAKLIQTILEKSGKKVFQNKGGANLLNGIASSIVLHSDMLCALKYDYAIFEIDENTLPLILKELNADYIVLLNLFRDQLDRYGEVNIIVKKWNKAIAHLPPGANLILNADDPQIAYLGRHLEGEQKRHLFFFGIENESITSKNHQHASDSTYCPNCGNKLIYNVVYFSHLGNWQCEKCRFKHPEDTFTKSPLYPLAGMHNECNTNAAVLLAKTVGIDDKKIKNALEEFKPAFGRQEDLKINGRKIKIFLSKNPTSFNESLRTIASLRAKNLLIILNDRIPDGRDVSWIWDTDFEDFSSQFKNITVSGDRVFDMGLRLKYAEFKNFQAEENLSKAISTAIEKTSKNDTLYILPTYSAMLEARKILTGKKIL